jgi:hypothetical protein
VTVLKNEKNHTLKNESGTQMVDRISEEKDRKTFGPIIKNEKPVLFEKHDQQR